MYVFMHYCAPILLNNTTGYIPLVLVLYELIMYIKTHGSELRGQEKCTHNDYQESIYAYQNV